MCELCSQIKTTNGGVCADCEAALRWTESAEAKEADTLADEALATLDAEASHAPDA